jgi:hypothetical protein
MIHGLIPGRDNKFFCLFQNVKSSSVAYPSSYSMSSRAFSLWLKQPGKLADHSLQSRAEGSDKWRYNLLPYAFVTCGGINFHLPLCLCGPGSSVGIVTGYGLDGPGIESR